MSERSRGDKWADVMRAEGAWVQKLPSSSLAGMPDWMLVWPPFGVCLVEAKKLQEKGSAFVPSQCSTAQRFFLEVVARHGGHSFILVLGPDRWYMQKVLLTVSPVFRDIFDALAEPYPEGWSEA